jgi:small subunit ribosomal protein S16
VAVKIKLKRLGKIREPYYRIVVADARTKRDGRAIEEIGKYHPKAEPSLIEVNSERVQHWLSVGAQPTDPVRVLLKVTGDWQKFTGESGTEGTLRTAAPREDKKERFATAAKESQASKAKDDKASGSAKAGSRSTRSAQGGRARSASAKAEAAPAEANTAEASTAEASTAEAAPAEASTAEAAPAEASTAEASTAEAAPAEASTAEASTAEAAPAEVAASAAETPADESGTEA